MSRLYILSFDDKKQAYQKESLDLSYILSLQLGHNATALLTGRRQVLGCVSQERFDGIKNSASFPSQPIEWLLRSNGITPKDISHIAICGETIVPKQLEHLNVEYNTAPDALQKIRATASDFYGWLSYRMGYTWLLVWFEKIRKKFLKSKSFKARESLIERMRQLGFDAPVQFVEHHVCHTYSPAYALGLEDKNPWLIFVMDGSGDEYFATVSVAENGKIQQIAASPWRHSLGYVYSKTTQFMGMKPLEHEYKVMGLAAYAKESYFKKTYDRVFRDSVTLTPHAPLEFSSHFPMNRFDWHLRATAVGERFDNLAGALQFFLEETTLTWIKNAIASTGVSRVMTSGGVFMNVKLNKRIQELAEVSFVKFMPSCGDESNPFGAAAYVAAQRGEPLLPISNLYLGHHYTNADIKDFIHKHQLTDKYHVVFHDFINAKIADLLADYQVVARVAGRAEFGARSLGNRAILANPSDMKSFFTVNDLIKSRDFWMPFAPSILEEDAPRYLINPKNLQAPFMITAFDATPLGQEHLRAAMHQGDKTVRPQIVTHAANPEYYDLIKEFKDKTGIGGVMNTSFNLHGHPLANTLEQSLFTFENSGLRHMALEGFLISKH